MKFKFSIFLFFLSSFFILNAQVKQVTETPKGISSRLQHEIDLTKDPFLGYVPKDRLTKAFETTARLEAEAKSKGLRNTFQWTDRGPYKDAVGPSNGNTRAGTNPITSGRARAMLVDLSDATGNTVWVGGVAGGLWKTTNIHQRPSTWQVVDDFLGNLAIGAITQDPTDHNIMYFGTGEKAINADAVRGAGIWRSTNGGNTWTFMTGTENFWNVSKMLCDASGNLYVGCNTVSNPNAGIKRFIKSTQTWSDITPSGLVKRVPDMVLSSTGRLHVVCGYFNSTSTSSGYRYTDNPATVTNTGWNSPSTTFDCRYNVALAVQGNTLYALPSNASWQVPTIYKSTNGGVNWTATGATPAFTSGQSWFCLAVAIDPNNVNNVMVGSLDCYRSTNGGSSWTKISNWVGTSGQYVHADQHYAQWMPNNRLYVLSDGGIHVSPDGGTTFTDRNEGLLIKQFYSIAIHPTSTNYFLGGTQDNGCHAMNQPGLSTSVEVTGGDGAFCHIDQTNGNFQFGSYVYNTFRRSTNGGSSWSAINYSSSTGRFINPSDYDDTNKVMFSALAANQYLVWTNPTSGSTFSVKTASALNNTQVSAVKVSPYTNNRVFLAGQANGVAPRLLIVDNASGTPTFTNISTGLPTTSSAYINCIEVGTSDQHLVAVFSNYGINNIWVSSNGGTSWTAIDGNLPDMPVRWAMFYPNDNTKMIIATETGVWQTSLINGSSTVWVPEPTFPNTRTDMLQYRASDGLIAAATHGRGLFTAFINEAPPTCNAPTGLNTSNVTTSSATLNWSVASGAVSYTVEYKLNSSSTWIVAAAATTSNTLNLTGLNSNSAYDWRVRTNCSSSQSGYSQNAFTTQSISCGTPTNLVSSSITASSATVSWSTVSGASNYAVEYKLSSASTWTVWASSTTATSANITGLSAATSYDWRVRANCSGTLGSYASAQFTTSAASSCPGSYDVSTNGTRSGAATIPKNEDIYGLINPSGDVDYFRFTIATAGTITITLQNLPANYHLYLHNNSGTQLASSTKSGTNNETINYNIGTGTFYVRVRGANSSQWNATNCYRLRVQTGTATGAKLEDTEDTEDVVEPTEDIAISVFPNPTQSSLNVYIIGKAGDYKIYIYDVLGKMVYEQTATDMLTTLDVSNLNKGTYFVRVESEEAKIFKSELFLKE